jgi:ring-1,2-phenylacetyl-CoA epoxidase subunit PaaD
VVSVAESRRDEIMRWLDEVMDPEVPVLSIRELGVLRDVEVTGDGVVVVMTPTYSGCPAMHAMESEVVATLSRHGVPNVRVKTVYSPAWTTDWILPEARAKLKAYGIAPPGRTESGELVQLLRHRPAVQCPYCDSHETELRSEFGATACKSVCWCRACRQPFEEFKAI